MTTTPARVEQAAALADGGAVAPAVRKHGGAVRERNGAIYAALVTGTLLSLAPMLIVLVNSFRTNTEIIREPLGLPTTVDVSNYTRAWFDASLGEFFINSVIVTLGSLVLGLAVALPLAYALGRWTFRGRAVIGVLFLAGLMVPLKIGVVPLADLYNRAGLTDSLLGLVLIYAASGLPLAVLILSAFYSQLPGELEEAALVDGAGHWTLFARIMTPLVRPAIAAVLVLNIGPAWNDFFMPLIFLRSLDRYTLPVGITTFFGEYSTDRGLLFAGIIIAIIPVAVFFALAMKHVVRGLTAGMGK